MELRHCCQTPESPFPAIPPSSLLLLQCSSNRTTRSFNATRPFKKHLRLPLLRWKVQIQHVSKSDLAPMKNFLVHVVKQGGTLTSISKVYAVFIDAITAANMDIVDVDLVLQGQHLCIPSATGDSKMSQTGENVLSGSDSSGRHKGRLIYWGKHLNHNISTVVSFCPLSHARTASYFLVLLPLIAFCIRCILDALQNRVARVSKQEAVNELEVNYRGSSRMRWKSVLNEPRDSDVMDVDSRPESSLLSGDQDQLHSDEMPSAYVKLEQDYEKFLAECGMSEWGYWRGGSPG